MTFVGLEEEKKRFCLCFAHSCVAQSLCDVRDRSLWLHCNISERIKNQQIRLKLDVSLDEFAFLKNFKSVYLNMFPCISPTF